MKMVKCNYSKDTMWLSINANEMLRESMQSFRKFLKDFNVDYVTYGTGFGEKVYMRLALTNEIVFNGNHEFYKGMGEWVYYYPINVLINKPKVSDYDILENMSIDPYDSDKWGIKK